MMRGYMLAAFALVAALTVVTLLIDLRRSENDGLRDFCRSTINSVRADLSALRSGNPEIQRGAVRRIADDRIFFGDGSVRVCLGSRMPDSSEWSACVFASDIPCLLERTARVYKLLTKEKR